MPPEDDFVIDPERLARELDLLASVEKLRKYLNDSTEVLNKKISEYNEGIRKINENRISYKKNNHGGWIFLGVCVCLVLVSVAAFQIGYTYKKL